MANCPACNMDLVAGMEECPGCGQTLRRAAPPSPTPAPLPPRPPSAWGASPVPAPSPSAGAPAEKPRNWIKIGLYLFAAQFVLGWLFLGVRAVFNFGSKPPERAAASEAEAGTTPQEAAPSPPPATGGGRLLIRVQDVYAPISYAQTMAPLMGVMAEKGYGNIKADDLKPAYTFVPVKGPGGVEITVQAVYSDTALMNAPATYVPMSLMQCLRRAAEDPQAQGLVVDPGGVGEVVLDKAGITALLDQLKAQGRADSDRPFAVMRLMNRGEGSPER